MTPVAFSTALPAIATMTRPANASEMPSWSIVGRSACTNQSETNAAPTPAAASRPAATASGTRGPCVSWACSDGRSPRM